MEGLENNEYVIFNVFSPTLLTDIVITFKTLELFSGFGIKAHGTKNLRRVVSRLNTDGFKAGFFRNRSFITEPFAFNKIFTPSKIVEDDESFIVRDTKKFADLIDFSLDDDFYIIESNKNDGFLDYMS